MRQKTTIIKKIVFIPAKPEEVYNALIDEKKHTEFTGSKASVNPKVGGRFTAWDGYIFGKNLASTKEKTFKVAPPLHLKGEFYYSHHDF